MSKAHDEAHAIERGELLARLENLTGQRDRAMEQRKELLSALEWLRDWYDENGPHTADSDARISLADAAIAKARGQS